MKFFIDTANVEEIGKAAERGMVDGVTTNPSLVARENGDFKKIIVEIASMVDGPVSAEVIATKFDPMVSEARNLAAIGNNVVIKIPMTWEGLKAVKTLSGEGIKTNVTLVFSPLQALMAAKAGASYVSPFVGRLDDISHDGMLLVEQIKTIFGNYSFATEIIVASVRSPQHVLDAALAGADIATIPYGVLDRLMSHPLTDLGLEAFLKDFRESGK